MKKIHWLLPFTVKNNNELLNANVASIRLRAGLFLNPIFKNNKISFSEEIDNLDKIDFLFIGKIGGNNIQLKSLWLDYASKHKKVILDITDDHLNTKTSMTDFYNSIISTNPNIVTSSTLLKNKLKQHSKEKIEIIEDPLEIQIQKLKNNNNKTFLWFGHESNRKYLYKLINNWPLNQPCNMIIMTSQNGINLMANEGNYISLPKNNNIKLCVWSVNRMIEISKSISGILIPGDKNDERKNGVSHNRLITSFALGCPVAATYYNSYLEFKDFFCDIDDPIKFENFINDNNQYKIKLEEAQEQIKKYSKNNIAKKWNSLLI